MKIHALITPLAVKLAVTAFLAVPVFCATITLPYNTGVLNDRTVASGGSTDLHYTDTIPGNTVYVLNSPNGLWLAPDAASKWVGPDTGDGSSYNGGSYNLDYQTTFNLTGYDPSSVALTGQWATDNYGTNILINGVPTGDTSSSYSSWSTFTISSGFVSGVNTLDFLWGNASGPGGVRIEFTSATGNPSVSGAPEPASVLLLAGPLVGLAFLRFRRIRQA